MHITTNKGYGFFEVSSAFQKAIRRSDEKQALFWMVELFNSNFDEYCWKRLRIMVSEDVGLAEPHMPATIAGLYSMYTDQKKKREDNRPERLFLTHAVLAMARANKSRMIDWLVIKCWREHDDTNLEIPDYAHDMHTQKGKKKGRGLDYFYDESTKLAKHTPVAGEDQAKAEAKVWHEKKTGKLSFGKPGKQIEIGTDEE
jgi:replication-associated recombination protein RarA